MYPEERRGTGARRGNPSATGIAPRSRPSAAMTRIGPIPGRARGITILLPDATDMLDMR